MEGYVAALIVFVCLYFGVIQNLFSSEMLLVVRKILPRSMRVFCTNSYRRHPFESQGHGYLGPIGLTKGLPVGCIVEKGLCEGL